MEQAVMMQALFSISGVAMACASVMPSTTTNSSRGSSRVLILGFPFPLPDGLSRVTQRQVSQQS